MAGNNTPLYEPDSVVAGDTIEWYRHIPDYPASDGWVLSYALVNESSQISITAGQDGARHLVSESAASTAGWRAGDYRWQSYVTKDGARHFVGSGTMKVAPNYAIQEQGYDGRGHAQKVLDALRATIEGKASNDQLAMSIRGRSISRLSPGELVKWLNFYENLARREANEEKIRRGLGSGNKIRFRMMN